MVLLFSPRISVIAFLQQFHPIFPIHVSSFPFSCTFCFQYTSSFSRFTRIYLFPATKSFLLFVSYLSSFHLTHFIHLAFFLLSLLPFSFIRSSLNETCIFSLCMQIISFPLFYNNKSTFSPQNLVRLINSLQSFNTTIFMYLPFVFIADSPSNYSRFLSISVQSASFASLVQSVSMRTVTVSLSIFMFLDLRDINWKHTRPR